MTLDEVNALEDIQDYWYQKLRRTHGLDGTEPQPPESTEDFNDIRTRQPGYPNEFSHSMESHDAVKYQNEQGWDAELEDEQLHEDSFFSSYEETPGLSTRDGDGLGNGYYRQQHQYRQEPYSQSDYHQGYSDPQPSQTAYESELNGSDLSHHYPFSVTPAGSNSPENDQQDEPVISNITLSPENEAVVSYDDGFSDSVPEFYNSYPYWQQSQSTPNFYDRLDLQPNES
ncbi:hypothetical protein GLAREA_11346 [Glarea lozoyensis ATCC 20868]|uniref:Uncharacterized protein n=1 Tax=Glarea lozoyensis (strain ATCC 20868 / MF5171) TaxID=1116229 RepID=S3DUL0_GLAL2|nr:uncharacterized protein GLAREA_11346 [Glarea lozoyensis ATCC 20868]EPE35646.1 hypothetical protein GLAREA_11346 [Glarea lozoyensis ATCC 20868]